MALDTSTLSQLEADRDVITRTLSTFVADNRLSWRVKTILDRNPYMASNMGAVMELAQMPISDNEVFENAGAMFGAQSAENLTKQLMRYTPSVQRAIFVNLTTAQQNALRQMGFNPAEPVFGDDGFFDKTFDAVLNVAGKGLSTVTKGIGNLVGPVLSPALNLLDEASDFIVGRPYRTIRQLGTDAQITAALSGTLATVAALALAPVTGGVSLAATAGIAGIAGASAGSLAQQAVIGNADDWWNAFQEAGNGEKLFTDGGIRRATEILGDPKLVNIAQRISLALEDDTTIVDIAQEIAGMEGSMDPTRQQKKLVEVAKSLVDENSPEFQAVYQGLTELVSSPLFQDAIKELEQSKLSIGRDVARLFGLDPDSGAYRLISGSVDAASLLLLDPFLVAGKVARIAVMQRRGMQAFDGAKAAERFRELAELPEIRRAHEVFAESINTGSAQLVNRYVPWLKPIYNEVLAHRLASPELADRVFTADDFVEWVVGSNQMASLMKGVGLVQGVSYGALKGLNRFQYAMRSGKGALGDFMQGAADMELEKLLPKLGENPQAMDELVRSLPIEVAEEIAKVASDEVPEFLSSLVRRQSALTPGAYEAGRAAGKLKAIRALGNFYEGLTTLNPRGTLIAIDTMKADSMADIDAFIDMFRTIGVPSYVREIWKRSIYQSPEVGTRLNALASMIDSAATATGIRSTLSGAQMLDNLLLRFRQHYALGKTGRFTLRRGSPLSDIEDIPIAVLPEADAATLMQIPDLTAMRKAVRQGTFMRVLAGVSDTKVIDSFQNKFWKPAVLLRFGFVVRNGTEDLLAFITRAGSGHFTQEFAARSIGQKMLYEETVAKVTPGLPLPGGGVGRIDAPLTELEQRALDLRYNIPSHMRPVARLVERFGSTGSPGMVYLSEYGDWLRKRLLYGFAPFQKLGKWVGQPIRYGLAEAGQDSRLRNFYQNLDLLAFGSETSIRRLLSGGANREFIESAVAFERKYLPSIMQRVGASSYLPWQRSNDGDQLVQRTISQVNSEKVPQQVWVRVSGERTLTREGVSSEFVEDFHEGILREVTRLFDDGPATRIMTEVSKVYNPELQALLPEEQLQQLLSLWNQTNRRIFDGESSNVLRLALLLNEPGLKPERFRAFVENQGLLGPGDVVDGKVVDVLKDAINARFGGATVPSSAEFRELWKELLTEARRSNKETLANELANFAADMNLAAALEEVTSPTARKWILANLAMDSATGGKHFTGKTGLTLSELLTNWRRTKGAEIPFYRSLDDALSSGTDNLIDEINQGQWDYVLSLNRDYVPGAKGTKFFVIQPLESLSTQLTPDVLRRAELLADVNGDYSYLASLLKVDLPNLSLSQRQEFNNFASSFVRALTNNEPLLVANKVVADELQKVVEQLHGSLKLVAPKVRTTWLPVEEGSKLTSAYPDLADRAAHRTTAIKSGLSNEVNGEVFISGVGWNTDLYPRPDIFFDELRKSTYPNNIINRLVDDINQLIRGGRRTKIVVRDDKSLYLNLNGRAVEIPPGTVLSDAIEPYADEALSQKVDIQNLAFTKPIEVSYEGNTEIMWGILGPILYDHAEEIGGSVVRAVKGIKTVKATDAYHKFGYKTGDDIFLPEDTIRVRASSVSDVKDTPAEVLPDWIIAQVYEPVYKNSWERFVQKGFNEVFSPILDAIARRPMAFHSFVNAHRRNVSSVSWLFRGTAEESALNDVINAIKRDTELVDIPAKMVDRLVESGRKIAELHSVKEFIYWNDEQVLAFLRSLNDDEIAALPTQFAHAIKTKRMNIKPAEAKALINLVNQNKKGLDLLFLDEEATAWAFLDRMEGWWGDLSTLPNRPLAIPGSSRQLTEDEWRVVKDAVAARRRAYNQAEEYAAEYAIRDIMPFIDTHEVRSQFADWARGYLPFWYAEENFLKRWARIFSLEGPLGGVARARKLQLAANGLRTMGVVREDPNGKSYFVYPGSELLIESVSKLPGIGLLPISAMLQTPTERIIPGFNPNFGAPGFSPLVAIPVEIATFLFPEATAIHDFQRNLMGDISVNQDILSLIVPAQVVNTFKAIYEYVQPFESTGNERLQSAMFAAIAHLDAAGRGLPDDATAEQRDDFLRKVRNHARVIVLSQAIAGWFTPGPAQALQVPDDQSSLSFLTNGQITNPAEIMSVDYFELIKNLGIEEGTIAYLEKYENNTINDVLNPLAYTVSRTESVSGAPLPMAEDGIGFYETNKELLDEYVYAGPWLLPQDASENGERSQYAYDAQMINGLRVRKTPEEFLTELKFREGAYVYFSQRKQFLDLYSEAEAKKQKATMKRLKGDWELFAQYWKATHPIFADRLVSSEARERRQNVIQEMRYLLEDPLTPQASHFSELKTLFESYDWFTLERSRLNLDRTAIGRTRVELFKKKFEEWVTDYVAEHPKVNSFWLTVLRPESGLD